MNEIKCPKCGEVFQVDESGYAAILKQVHDSEFNKELTNRLKEHDKAHESEVELAVAKANANKDKKITDLQNTGSMCSAVLGRWLRAVLGESLHHGRAEQSQLDGDTLLQHEPQAGPSRVAVARWLRACRDQEGDEPADLR